MVIDPDHGTIDSPLNPNQVELCLGVPEALSLLTKSGFGLAIVSNQPAAAKGKVSKRTLEEVHETVVRMAESAGGLILSSHLCFHRAEDQCACRKPKTGLLEAAFAANPDYSRDEAWMVGDGVTDLQAGQSLNLRNAFLGSRKCDACKIMEDAKLKPRFWGANLMEFAQALVNGRIDDGEKCE